MISSVVGFDIGYSTCFIGVARGGGIDIIDNDFSKRDNPTCVAYGSCSDGRQIGPTAALKRSSNIKHTIGGFKPLIGRQFDDPLAQISIRDMYNDVVRREDNTIGFNVQYEKEQVVLTPENITSTLFTFLKGVAQNKLGFPVTDCVISCPLYLSDYQRRAMIFAARTVGLNVLRLINDTTSVALAYGIYKQDLPIEKEKARLVVFVDIGDNDTQVSAVGFNKGKLEVKKSVADPALGGRHFGDRIYEFFRTEFMKKYKLDVASRAKAILRLKTECEKLKKTMSANVTSIPLNIECFMNDVDVKGRMDRQQFEDLTVDLFERLKTLLQSLLHEAQFTVEEIDAVEIVGAATRMPRSKTIIEEVFNKVPSTTLNSDDTCARGCALQCAILSPAFKVRDFTISDVTNAGIKLNWYDPNGKIGGEMEVFCPNHVFPFSKMLTFYRKEKLILEASYSTPLPHTQNIIGRFEVGPIKPTEDGSSVKVKVKVNVDINGCFHVESAHTVTKIQVPVEEEKKEEKKEEKMETEEKPTENGTEAKNGKNENETDDNAEKIEKTDSDEKMKENCTEEIIPTTPEKKPKMKTKTINHPLEVSSSKHGFTVTDLNAAMERECGMVSNDKLVRDRLVAKNAVESYMYDTRGKLYEQLEEYISEDDKAAYLAVLEGTEDWLYEEGMNCQKQVYIDKLAELRKEGDRVQARCNEAEQRPKAMDQFGTSLVRIRKVIEFIISKEEQYVHLEGDLEVLQAKVDEYAAAHVDIFNKISKQQLHEDPAVLVCQINNKRKEFEDKVNPIVNKPKPKVEPPPVPAPEEAAPAAAEEPKEDAPMEPAEGAQPEASPAEAPAAEQTSMDLD